MRTDVAGDGGRSRTGQSRKLAGCTVRNGSAARTDRERPCRWRGRSAPARLFGRGLGRAASGGVKTAAACAGVGSRVSADRDQKVRHAARLDGPGIAGGTSVGRSLKTWLPSWTGWEWIDRIGWTRCATSVACSSKRQVERARLCELHRVARGAGFRARRPHKLRFSERAAGCRATVAPWPAFQSHPSRALPVALTAELTQHDSAVQAPLD